MFGYAFENYEIKDNLSIELMKKMMNLIFKIIRFPKGFYRKILYGL